MKNSFLPTNSGVQGPVYFFTKQSFFFSLDVTSAIVTDPLLCANCPFACRGQQPNTVRILVLMHNACSSRAVRAVSGAERRHALSKGRGDH